MKKIFILIRIKQWLKNLIIFAPLIFSFKLFDVEYLKDSFITFFLFCLLSSIIYVFNDICDYNYDKIDPNKRKIKPLANKDVTFNFAYLTIFILFLICIPILIVQKNLIFISIIFLILNFSYSLYFKEILIIDIFFISFSFIVRVIAGAIGIDVHLSEWMFTTIFSVSIYLAAFKRVEEIKSLKKTTRKVLKNYNLNFLYKIVDISAICSIIFYSLYVINVNSALIISIPIVFYGFFRYYYISEKKIFGESPIDIILKDIYLILTIIFWFLSVLFAFYLQSI